MDEPSSTESAGLHAVLLMPDQTLADILAKAIAMAHYKVALVDGVRALFENGEWEVDLIATALRLPDGDAFQLIEMLAQRNYAGRVLFVGDSPPALHEAAVDLATGRGLDVVGSFESPFSLRGLLRTLEEHSPLLKAASQDETHPEEGEFKVALARGDIEAVFQPKIDLESGEMAGFEALARWNHVDLGLLTPARFIGRAENDGLIHELSEEILRQSLPMLQQCRGYAPRAKASVNLSGVSLGLPDLPERMYRITEGLEVRTSQVIFEVTETQMLMDSGHAMANVNRLRLMGFGLALDDYGTGFSSLTRIKSLPFTELKVDRRFVNGAAKRPSLIRILENCLSLGRDLGMKVVAEGVEQQADWELVRALGFDMVQGFYESPPLGARDLKLWLKRRYGEGA